MINRLIVSLVIFVIELFQPTVSWPSGKGVAAVTSATWVQLTVGGTIYNAWVPGKEVKTPFILSKKKIVSLVVNLITNLSGIN